MSVQLKPHADLNDWVAEVQDPKTRRYIQERVMEQMDYYKTKSKACKKMYQRLTTWSIIIGFFIPIASILADGSILMKIIIAALGSGATAVGAWLKIQNYYDQWTNYRYYREYLLSVLYSYFLRSGAFKRAASQEEADEMLISICESCFCAENKGWKSFHSKEDSAD